MVPTKFITTAAIQTGDLLAWSRDPYSTATDVVLQLIEKITRSDYGHVGIAWRFHDGLDDELFVVEATMPKIRIARLTSNQPFYCVPMNVNWDEKSKSFLMSKIGYPYGFLDAIRGGLGIRVKHDMKWQCAELAHAFYEVLGIVLKDDYRPGALVKNAMQIRGSDIYRVIGPGRTIDTQT